MNEIIKGIKLNRLTPLKRLRIKGHWYWKCGCDCGSIKIIKEYNIKNNRTKSCGCYRKEMPHDNFKTHGMTRTPEHIAWCSMNQRCRDANCSSYKYYGGRGIKICARWNKFENFFKDMGKRPSTKHSLDRIINSGDYKPSNCRWATDSQQAYNKRKQFPRSQVEPMIECLKEYRRLCRYTACPTCQKAGKLLKELNK